MKVLILIASLFVTMVSATASTISTQRVGDQITVHIDGKFPENPMVDYLFVIDNSGSMDSHQQNLVQHVDLFINKLKNTAVDFHVGVINTDNTVNSGELIGVRSFISSRTPSWETYLKENLLVGVAGNWREKFFEVTLTALTPPLIDTRNKGFLRSGSTLSIVYFTDADATAEEMNPLEFVYKLSTEVRPINSVEMNAFVITDRQKNKCFADDQLEGNKASQIMEAVRLVNKGKSYGLCDGEMHKNLEDFVSRVVPDNSVEYKPSENLKNIQLVGEPSGSIKVNFGSQRIMRNADTGWSYDSGNNTISFGDQIEWVTQPRGTTIDVHYRVKDQPVQ